MRGLLLVLLGLLACEKQRPAARGVGDRLQAFIVQDSEKRNKQCFVCAYAGKPTILAVGELDDARFEDDLAAIEAIRAERPGLTAFAVLGRFEGGTLRSPADEAAALEALEALRARRGIGFPLSILPKEMSPEQRQNYAPFGAAYAIDRGRTVWFADADNHVRYAATWTEAGDAEGLAKAAGVGR